MSNEFGSGPGDGSKSDAFVFDDGSVKLVPKFPRKIVMNYQFKRWSWFWEIRYVKPNLTGSFPLISIYWGWQSVSLSIWPFIFSITVVRKFKPKPLTPEEQKEFDEMMND